VTTPTSKLDDLTTLWEMEESFEFRDSSSTLQLTNVFGTDNCTEPINNRESWEFKRDEEGEEDEEDN
jgi:phage terminase large subunit